MNIKEKTDAYTDWAIGLRRYFHQHPEVSLKEYNTTAKIKEILTELGIGIKETGLETGLIAEIKGEKQPEPGQEPKLLAVRADIDALPVKEATGEPFASENEGFSHACGHDTHMACILLAARILNENKADYSGTVRLLFQPAEESGDGARMMIEQGAMADPKPDLVLGIHTWPDTPAGMVGVKPGPSHASSDTIRIKVIGKGGHGAHPYRCVDPIITAAYLLTQLQTVISRELPMVQNGVLTFGSIHGGTAPNVIPDTVEITGTLRSHNAEWREKMIESIKRISASCCEAMRATAEVEISEGMPPLVNVPEVIEGVRRAANKVLGEGHVHELANASPGSDDFARYLELVPGAMFRMGTGNEDPATHIGLHNGKNRFDEKGIPTTAAVVVQFIEDYLA